MNAMHTLTDNTFDQRSSGFSMVELMVAMTISLLLMAGVVQIFSGSRASYVMQEGTSRLQENARFTLGRLSHDISAAGYLGCLDSANPVRPFTNDLSDQTAASGYDFATPLFGTEGTGANGSDTINISRASATTGIRLTAGMDTEISDLQLDATDNAYQALEQFDILAVGDCGTASVFMITNDPTTSGGLIQHDSGVAATGGPNNGQSNLTGDLGAVYGADRASVAGAYRVGTTTYLLCASHLRHRHVAIPEHHLPYCHRGQRTGGRRAEICSLTTASIPTRSPAPTNTSTPTKSPPPTAGTASSVYG